MPRNAGGTFSLVSGNPVISGTVISSTWANNTLDDIATAITESVCVDGRTPMTGPLKQANGTVALPSYTFTSEVNTGIYLAGSGNLAFTVGGVERYRVTSTNRFQADFSNVTQANRFGFQTSTTNGTTSVSVIPNGTATSANVAFYSNSTLVSSSLLQVGVDGTSGFTFLRSETLAGGTVLPLTFFLGGTERFRLHATENRFQADFSDPTVVNRFMFQTSTNNAGTTVSAIPSGTGTFATFVCYGGLDPSNTSSVAINCNVATGRSVVTSSAAGTGTNLPLCFDTAGSERARITTAGGVFVGTAAAVKTDAAGRLQVVLAAGVNGPSDAPLALRHNSSTAGRFWNLGPNGGADFLVTNDAHTGVYITYGLTGWSTVSDETIKTDLVDITTPSDKLMTIRTKIGRFLADPMGTERLFFLAQDWQAVLPQVVSEAPTGDGKLGLAYAETTVLLAAALKEQILRADNFEARITALEAAVFP